MSSSRIVFLMYHELELAGRKLCQSEPGYVRYILPLETFRSQMAWLKESGWRGLNVGEAIRYPAEPGVCITFDDGCETDLIAAAPVLREFGFNATFYLTAGFLGTPGYLNADQVRELDAQGFQIGCHSMTHPYLSDLPEAGTETRDRGCEAADRKHRRTPHRTLLLSRRTLRPAHAANGAPGRIRDRCQQRVSCELARTNPYELGRVAMLRDLTIEKFAATCHGRGLWKKHLQHELRRSAQRLLGNRAYDRLRAAALGEPRQ